MIICISASQEAKNPDLMCCFQVADQISQTEMSCGNKGKACLKVTFFWHKLFSNHQQLNCWKKQNPLGFVFSCGTYKVEGCI